MIETLNQIEQRLAKAYAEEAQHYDCAVRVMERSMNPDTAGDDWVLELQGALKHIAAIEAAIADDKLAWQQSGRRAGEPLREILTTVASSIRILAEQVDRSVAAVTEKRRRLLPDLDGFIRQRRMLHAYDQYSKGFEKTETERTPGI